MSKKNKKGIRVLVILFVLLCSIAFYNRLVVRKYTIETTKLSEKASVRIVLISDLHSHIYGKEQKNIADLIRKQNPDMIALAGDIADDVEPIEGTEMFWNAIKGIAPIYYVTGNHEFWSRDIDSIKSLFRMYGVKVLENEYEEIEINGSYFIIGGVDDPEITVYQKPNFDWSREMYETFSKLESRSEYKILLSHRPEYIELYRSIQMDLVLSGHAHGGQVRIPFLLNGLLAPNQGWFPKYAGGLYKHSEFTHIVSRGVSFNPKLPRIFNPPEVVVIDIVGKE